MAGVRFTELQSRPMEFLDLPSLTLDEFQQGVLAFAAATGVKPQDVAVVGDSLHDFAAAHAAGAVAIAVESGPAPGDVLAARADAVIASIADLPAWLAAR